MWGRGHGEEGPIQHTGSPGGIEQGQVGVSRSLPGDRRPRRVQ